MDQDLALAVAAELHRRDVSCRLERDAGSGYRVRVQLLEDREALWDVHGDLLEGRVLRDGALRGFVSLPVVRGVSSSGLAELVANQRYDQLSASGRSGSLADPATRGRQRQDQTTGRRRRPAALFWLLVAMVAVMLLLYLLDGRR